MISAFPVRKALFLFPCLLVVLSSGAAQNGTREVMADVMARMMEAMGLFDSAPARRGMGGSSADLLSMVDPYNASSWGSAVSMPWEYPTRDPSQASAMRDMTQRFSQQMTAPGEQRNDEVSTWKPSRLEGVWEGRDGELLIVQGSRFRIYSPTIQRVDGFIQARGERLALYNPLDKHVQAFEFAESQGRLAMRDLAGQIYLYRRLRLDVEQRGRGAVDNCRSRSGCGPFPR